MDYVVKDGQVIIVDEFTGRIMPGRRFSEGLHQALEAKEGVKIENENQTLATITFQNYFRMYNKLAGMTGTADTEAEEFKKIYKLEVVVIPTHMKMIREDFPDPVYKTKDEKFRAVVEDIKDCYDRGQPVWWAPPHRKVRIPEQDAETRGHPARGAERQTARKRGGDRGPGRAEVHGDHCHQHGRPRHRHRAGRGVVATGGLHILGTERHESRRIDNQLRGRSGRQGDPGSSRFYLSLEDDLMRIFGGDRIKGLMGRLGMEDGQPIEHRLVSNAIERAQKQVEGHNFDIRKHLLEYDDVMNKQREVIYAQRRQILAGETLQEDILEMARELVEELTKEYTANKLPEEWDLDGLAAAFQRQFGFRLALADQDGDLREYLGAQVEKFLAAKAEEIGPELFGQLQQMIMLQIVDNQWKDHLLSMDHLRDGIGLRGYAQVDPLREYQREGYDMFMELIHRMEAETVGMIFHVQVKPHQEIPEEARPQEQPMFFSHGDRGPAQPQQRQQKKTGRNDPCPCGSGKKYKKCCGK